MMERERLCSLSGLKLKDDYIRASPMTVVKQGVGVVTITLYHYVEASHPTPFVSSLQRGQPVDLWCFVCLCHDVCISAFVFN